MSEEDKDSPDGLFTVKCACGVEFPAENGKCSCGETKGDLKLDIDQFLNRVYAAQSDEDRLAEDLGCGMDLVFDVFWHLWDRFDIMNDILEKVDVSKINTTLMVGFLSQTFKYEKQVPNHLVFFNRVRIRLEELGESKSRITRLLKGFNSAGDYWDNMEAYGAPAWLSGPKP